MKLTTATLSFEDFGEIVDVFADAFHDYPVMRWVLGRQRLYDKRLHRLVELFVSGRAYRNEPMFGVRDRDGTLVAAATMTLPTPTDPAAEFFALRESVWAELGTGALARYDAFAAAAEQFSIDEPHHHLNMLGVRRAHQGRGLARLLLEAVHDLASADPDSAGVTLSTEHPPNVKLYEHFGYRVHGHARVGDGLETWTLFRPART